MLQSKMKWVGLLMIAITAAGFLVLPHFWFFLRHVQRIVDEGRVDTLVTTTDLPHSSKRTIIVMLAFWNTDMIESALSSLMPYRNQIDVVVAEIESPHSNDIQKAILPFVDLVLLHIRTPNIFGMAFALGLHASRSLNLVHHPYLCFSDGDIIAYGAWLEEVHRLLLLDQSIHGVCLSLNPFNTPDYSWIERGPINNDYIQAMCVYLRSRARQREREDFMFIDCAERFSVSMLVMVTFGFDD
jgi:hypothetical protein